MANIKEIQQRLRHYKSCNEVIAVRYGAPEKMIECFNGVKIALSEVCISQTCAEGWAVVFKKKPASILKEEIDAQEMYEITDLLEMDYPPKIEINIRRVPPSSKDSDSLHLHVKGLDKESTFILQPDDILTSGGKNQTRTYSGKALDNESTFILQPDDTLTSGGKSQTRTHSAKAFLDTSAMKKAVSEVKDEIQEKSRSFPYTSALLPTASEMVAVMERIEQLLQYNHNDSVREDYLMKLEEMEIKCEQFKQKTKDLLRFANKRYAKCTINFVERMSVFAVEMKKIFETHRNTTEWQSAVSIFIANSANLMNAVRDTLRAAKLAVTFSNIKTQVQESEQQETLCEFPQPSWLSPKALVTTKAAYQSQPREISSFGPLDKPQFLISLYSNSATATSPTMPSSHTPPSPLSSTSALSQQQTSPKKLTSAINRNPFSSHAILPPLSSTTTTPKQPEPKPLTMKEHMAGICKCLFPLRAEWRTIGMFLSIEYNTLEAIRADNEKSGDRLIELIAEWLKRCKPPPTGQALAEAVQMISPDRADEIRRMFTFT